jgi:hypothetical protein
MPCLNDHHDNEEKIFFPLYGKRGVVTPQKQGDDHKSLLVNFARVGALTRELNEAIVAKRPEAEVAALGRRVADTFIEAAHHVLEHLSEEEVFWPPIVAQHGEAVYNAAEKAILDEGKKRGNKAFTLILCSITCAMGMAFGGHPASNGWASNAFKESFSSKLPLMVHKLLAPSWMRQYLKYRNMLLALAETADVPAAPSPDCWCVIA